MTERAASLAQPAVPRKPVAKDPQMVLLGAAPSSSIAEAAASDSDFDAVRNTDEFRSAIARQPQPGRTGS